MPIKTVRLTSPLNNTVHPETAATVVLLADAGTYYTATDVENALQEIGASLATLAATPITLTTSATTADQVLDAFAVAVYSSAKYLIQVKSGTAIHFTEITLVYNTETASALISEYGTIMSSTSLALFTADVSTGNLRLLTTPTNAITVYNVSRTTITA